MLGRMTALVNIYFHCMENMLWNKTVVCLTSPFERLKKESISGLE